MYGIQDDQLESVRRAAINGEYHLMLGAGASRDTVSRVGVKLPGSERLIEMLVSEFDVAFETGDQLWRVYDRAVGKAGQETVYDWLRAIFFATTPPSWMDKYARFPWHTVWTLNIDDSFEKAYARVATEQSRALSTKSWDDDSVFRNKELPLVHLHGHVLSAAPQALVFSLTEYQEAMVSRAAWPLIFRDTYGISPFVIIGARLRDEPDIEKVVARRAPAQAAPSLYVSRSISAAMEEDLRSWNLIPVRATAEEFAAGWHDLTGIDLDTGPSRDDEVGFRFGRQFVELSTNNPGRAPADHDVIGGDEPHWRDIVENRYAQVDWIRQGTSLAGRFGNTVPAASLLLYTGRRLTGRTAGVLGIAKAFRQKAWRVFQFSADERVDTEAVLQFASDGRGVLLLFDGVADVAEDVQVILERARRSQLNVACLAVDHPDREAGIVGRISSRLFVDQSVKSINERLTRTDAARLVDHLDKAGRLGVLEPLKDRDRLRHFIGKGLFSALAAVEEAPGFGSRVESLTADLQPGAARDLCLLAVVAEKVGRTLLVIDAARMLQIDSEDILKLCKSPVLSELIWSDGHRVMTRHRWMALGPLMRDYGTRDAMEFLADAVARLSRRANRSAHRERNATTMLVGSMMIYRNLVELFPDQDLGLWYQKLQTAFGHWSGRYWEQRAILGRNVGRDDDAVLARAESFAQRAVTLVKDPYSYTTLGTILAARAALARRELVQDFYDRAYDAFDMSSELDPSNLVTWIAYLRHTLPLLSRLSLDAEVGELEEQMFDDWTRIFGQIYPAAAASDSTRDDLDRVRRRFQAIERSSPSGSPTTEAKLSDEFDADGALD